MKNLQPLQSFTPKKSTIISLEKGKIPPQALDLEEAVLGAMMIDKKGVDDVIDTLDSRWQQVAQVRVVGGHELFDQLVAQGKTTSVCCALGPQGGFSPIPIPPGTSLTTPGGGTATSACAARLASRARAARMMRPTIASATLRL